VDMKLEVVVVPVSDVDRAKQFYKGLGWREDADFVADEDFRIVQLTPPGSGGSIQFGVGLTTAPPGSLRGMYLVVDDIEAARVERTQRGAPVSEAFHEARLGARFLDVGAAEREAGPEASRQTYGSFLSFDDPDGNGWIVQEISTRLPGRE
jgi:catechol 2,3-dioxygenase-like lactoylglutathione lyase family enzyme